MYEITSRYVSKLKHSPDSGFQHEQRTLHVGFRHKEGYCDILLLASHSYCVPLLPCCLVALLHYSPLLLLPLHSSLFTPSPLLSVEPIERNKPANLPCRRRRYQNPYQPLISWDLLFGSSASVLRPFPLPFPFFFFFFFFFCPQQPYDVVDGSPILLHCMKICTP